jgi:hypothetical protein
MTTPFETNDCGQYLVLEPAEGMRPDSIQLEFHDVTYELRDFVGRETESRVHPDVLAYDECTVVSQE